MFDYNNHLYFMTILIIIAFIKNIVLFFFYLAFLFVYNNHLYIHSLQLHIFLFNNNFWKESIWPVYATLTDTTTPGQSGRRSSSNKGIHYTPEIEHHWQIQLSVLPETLLYFGGVLLLYRWDNQCCLNPINRAKKDEIILHFIWNGI